MTKKIFAKFALVLAVVTPCTANAKTLIPIYYQCLYNVKIGDALCATTCVNKKTGQLVSLKPAVCLLPSSAGKDQ
jgi:hypothetical protein